MWRMFSICNWGQEQVHTWGAEVGHLWRTTHDILGNWDRVMWILDQQVGLDAYSGPDGWNDPDMLEVGNPGLTSIESRAHFSLWAILNAPLIAGHDVRTMSAETQAILTDPDVIAVNQDWSGIQGRRIRDDGEQEVWYKPMSDGSAAVVLLNRSTSIAPIVITWSEIHLAPSPEYTVTDLWSNENVVVRERYEAIVPAHGAVMIRVSPQDNDGAMYLSDFATTPVTNGFGSVERDRSNGEDAAGDGVPLSINGTRYSKGLGVHAYSEIRFALNRQCSAFQANVGIDDEVGPRGSVVFHVVVDGTERYTSTVVTGASAPESVLVSLAGASELALIVTDADDGPYFDHADWAGAQIHCNGASASYLSDRSWTWMNNGWGPVERDRSNGEIGAMDGRTLTLNGTRFTRGLGVHSYSDVRYVLNGRCSTFEANVGVDDEVGSLGSVVFRVFVDGVERYTSRVMTGAAATEPVLVSVAGAGVLALVVTDGGDGPSFDHADWADARLHCGGTTSVDLRDRS